MCVPVAASHRRRAETITKVIMQLTWSILELTENTAVMIWIKYEVGRAGKLSCQNLNLFC